MVKFSVIPLLLVSSLCWAPSWSFHSVSLPYVIPNTGAPTEPVDLTTAFENIVGSTDFLQKETRETCRVPLFGDDVRVTFDPANDGYQLSMSGDDISEKDFGWICKKFYDCRDQFDDTVCTEKLKDVVLSHFNKIEAFTGFAAETAAWSGSDQINKLFSEEDLQTLQNVGFVVIDEGSPKMTEQQHSRLSDYLVEKTKQSKEIRTDTVHFLMEEEAEHCDLDSHYNSLMGIATYLNDNYNFEETGNEPMAPATREAPVTIPRSIQLAEYEQNGFYVPHSDNSLTDDGSRRKNFRRFTCILYCNDDWEEQDGGALRIWHASQGFVRPDDATYWCQYDDILPKNGRLIVFDSRLVHSVLKVKHPSKVRRALTLWLNRPEDVGVEGKIYY